MSLAAQKPVMGEVDFNRSPFVVIWEVTRACDLDCKHCRAAAIPLRDPGELSTEEGLRLTDEVLRFQETGGQPPLFVLTGGDPMKRPDIYDFISYGTDRGLTVSLSPSATPLVTRESIFRMRDCGLARMAISLDGPDADSHDAFRQVQGSFDQTMRMILWSAEAGLPLQMHTTISRYNRHRLDELGQVMLSLPGVVMWSLFLLVPTGRGKAGDLVSAEDFEEVFNWLYDFSKKAPFDVRTTAAQHFRRVVLQRRAAEKRDAQNAPPDQPGAPRFSPKRDVAFTTPADGISRAPKGVNDGNGFVFISHVGEINPSGFLPINCGNVRTDSLVEVYRNSPVFRALRDPNGFKGKCGVCEFRFVCGGSRARAYAITGDYLESEPFCVYEPKRNPAAAGRR
ncbi:MAG: TIGR04053 family radical SAM/SPASM domain-containing protein [Verrucomicrobiae bacterium]|nr:TIGR04053 family radical SAM/SPASM domain-containing protein [Verrucomicrobiae bacterium]